MATRKALHSEARHALKEQLKDKGRQRRAGLLRSDLAEAGSRNDLLPRLDLVTLPIDQIRLPARKVRKASEKHIDEVMRSISRFGLLRSRHHRQRQRSS